jgi:hypothetical protein
MRFSKRTNQEPAAFICQETQKARHCFCEAPESVPDSAQGKNASRLSVYQSISSFSTYVIDFETKSHVTDSVALDLPPINRNSSAHEIDFESNFALVSDRVNGLLRSFHFFLEEQKEVNHLVADF